PQVFPFILGELKHEILGKAIPIAFHGAVQRLCLNAVDRREIGVQHYAFTADFVNESTKLITRKFVRRLWHRATKLLKTFPMRSRFAQVNSSLLSDLLCWSKALSRS